MQGVNLFVPVLGGRYLQITFINYVHDSVQITFKVDAIQFHPVFGIGTVGAVNWLDAVSSARINQPGRTDDDTHNSTFARQLRGRKYLLDQSVSRC